MSARKSKLADELSAEEQSVVGLTALGSVALVLGVMLTVFGVPGAASFAGQAGVISGDAAFAGSVVFGTFGIVVGFAFPVAGAVLGGIAI